MSKSDQAGTKGRSGIATVRHTERRHITVCQTSPLIDRWPPGCAVQSSSSEMLIRISTRDLPRAVTGWWKMQMKFDPDLSYLTTRLWRRTKCEMLWWLVLWCLAYLCGLDELQHNVFAFIFGFGQQRYLSWIWLRITYFLMDSSRTKITRMWQIQCLAGLFCIVLNW